ncbi:hypothetical protein AVEN_23808-1 [Araneus ventricosus]|uniref:Uncharacterized protein n=1 Tax=Araneus ventricosus TaxID=182803 RepID=A0A4Y2K0T7_ARAVE|nr:hypothetical protein AVEN_23808-1 [Araneus ventricosus]
MNNFVLELMKAEYFDRMCRRCKTVLQEKSWTDDQIYIIRPKERSYSFTKNFKNRKRGLSMTEDCKGTILYNIGIAPNNQGRIPK